MDFTMIIIMLLMILMFVFTSRSQKKRENKLQELRSNLEIGDVVLTEAGISGRVISVKDPETITIETGSDKTRLKFKRWAVISKEAE